MKETKQVLRINKGILLKQLKNCDFFEGRNWSTENNTELFDQEKEFEFVFENIEHKNHKKLYV